MNIVKDPRDFLNEENSNRLKRILYFLYEQRLNSETIKE